MQQAKFSRLAHVGKTIQKDCVCVCVCVFGCACEHVSIIHFNIISAVYALFRELTSPCEIPKPKS